MHAIYRKEVSEAFNTQYSIFIFFFFTTPKIVKDVIRIKRITNVNFQVNIKDKSFCQKRENLANRHETIVLH